MRFADVMRMADYWVEEPPISILYKAVHFRQEGQEEDNGLQPNLMVQDYERLPESLKYAVRKSWLKRNPGKTEEDFHQVKREKEKTKWMPLLEEARRKKKMEQHAR